MKAAPDHGKSKEVSAEAETPAETPHVVDGSLEAETQPNLDTAQHDPSGSEADTPPHGPPEKEGAQQEEIAQGAPQSADAESESQAICDLIPIVESLIFASQKPLPLQRLRRMTGASKRALDEALEQLKQRYCGGVELIDVDSGYQFRTHPSCANWVRRLLAGKPPRLTRAMLETLAIVAYRQPVTRPEIDEIRGVDSGGTLRVLLERNLVRIVGKKEEAGRPLLYGTTKSFLEFFQLRDLKALPSLRDFAELSEEHQQHVDEVFGSGRPSTLTGTAASDPKDAPHDLSPLGPVAMADQQEREAADVKVLETLDDAMALADRALADRALADKALADGAPADGALADGALANQEQQSASTDSGTSDGNTPTDGAKPPQTSSSAQQAEPQPGDPEPRAPARSSRDL